MMDFLPLLMFVFAFAILLSGFPVAFCLAGTALIFAGIGILSGHFDTTFLAAGDFARRGLFRRAFSARSSWRGVVIGFRRVFIVVAPW